MNHSKEYIRGFIKRANRLMNLIHAGKLSPKTLARLMPLNTKKDIKAFRMVNSPIKFFDKTIADEQAQKVIDIEKSQFGSIFPISTRPRFMNKLDYLVDKFTNEPNPVYETMLKNPETAKLVPSILERATHSLPNSPSRYDEAKNKIISITGSPAIRHELGHWKYFSLPAPSRKKLISSVLRAAHVASPDLFKAMFRKLPGFTDMPPVWMNSIELAGQRLAALGKGRGAQKTRELTQKGYNPGNFKKLPGSYQSAIEHLVRNYLYPLNIKDIPTQLSPWSK